MKYYWKNSYEYKRIMEIFEDYWLTEPDEKKVEITMHFEKADGQFQDKVITWLNPNMEHEHDDGEFINLADGFEKIRRGEI